MPAPSADFPALGASTSSSGYSDGLGRRALAFDREDGTMLERLVVRAELCAFERSLRDRLERIAALDDERIARPRSLERSHDGLIVLSEFVPGSRLSDLLDAVAHQGSVPGMDVGLGYLLDVLPALCGLHAGAGFAHGAISAGRTVLTPAGQVVLLDGIYGEALARVQYSRQRLWTEFGVAMPPAAGPPRFDAACDIAQAALCGVMLMLGRPIRPDEYPDAIPALLVEAVDVAQIRGSGEFAGALQRFLQRALPLQGRRPYTAADDALIEARDLARELGLDACRRALLEFIEQQDGGSSSGLSLPRAAGASIYDETALDPEYDYAAGSNGAGDLELDTEEAAEFELDLETGAHAVLERAVPEEETVYDISAGAEAPPHLDTPELAAEPEADEPTTAAPFEADAFVPRVEQSEPPPEPLTAASAVSEPAPFVDEPVGQTRGAEAAPFRSELEAARSEFEAALTETAADAATEPNEGAERHEDALAETEAAPAIEEESAEGQFDTEPDFESDSRSSRRRKRARSARSRKDKLRSAARPAPLAAPPVAPPRPAPPVAAGPPPASASAPPAAPVAAKPTTSGWLVEPARPAAFEPPVPPQPPPAPLAAVPVAPPPVQPIPLAPPPPRPIVPLAPTPTAAPPPMPRPVVVPQPVLPPVQPIGSPAPIQVAPPVPPPLAPAAPALKLKTTTPAGYTPTRKPRPEPVADIYSARSTPDPIQEPAEFPWKLAAAAVVFIAVAIVGGRAYMKSGSSASAAAAVSEAARPVVDSAAAAAAKTGKVQIETQPAGARVLLAGKHLGDAPLTIDLPAGRHTLTFATTSDSVRRTVRVEAGKTLTLSVPIYRGWLDVSAPIILEVSEAGKHLGSTEQSQLMLPPGRHELTFTNRDLDYTSTQVVEIVPGEGKRLTIDPRGTANLNASPWAEVWINGKKIGETPLANQQLPLGTHEIVFKHPQYGERRMTTTIRANAPVALSVDMTRPIPDP